MFEENRLILDHFIKSLSIYSRQSQDLRIHEKMYTTTQRIQERKIRKHAPKWSQDSTFEIRNKWCHSEMSTYIT